MCVFACLSYLFPTCQVRVPRSNKGASPPSFVPPFFPSFLRPSFAYLAEHRMASTGCCEGRLGPNASKNAKQNVKIDAR